MGNYVCNFVLFHFATISDFQEGLFEIGKHSSSENLSVFLNVHNFILRHSAVLGSTGSGKSNTTAHIIKNILSDYRGSRIILVDIHGEYKEAFKDKAKIFRINDAQNPLYVPYWAMSFDELSFFLVGRPDGQEHPDDKILREAITTLKKENAGKLKAGQVDPNFVTADSPIPFDLRKIWYEFNRDLNATYSVSKEDEQTRDKEMLVSEGNPQELIPAKFTPYAISIQAPYKSKHQTMYAYEKKIHSRLKDTRFDFMFKPGDYSDSTKSDMDKLLRDWIDHEQRLTILDLSGVPFELVDISVGLITRIIFDSMYWGRSEPYTGKNRPLLMVFEEAHSYLPKGESSANVYGYARKAVEKIFKEGRKFGVGAMVVTQRPSEISETILAQVGTFIALRLTNSSDKNTVQSASPNNMTSLIDLLQSLRIGEAIVVGESIVIPSRVRIELVEPKPSSADPKLVEQWQKEFKPDENNYKKVVTALREQKHIRS
jgi:DNA helicase HerA-like ATPase